MLERNALNDSETLDFGLSKTIKLESYLFLPTTPITGI